MTKSDSRCREPFKNTDEAEWIASVICKFALTYYINKIKLFRCNLIQSGCKMMTEKDCSEWLKIL